MAVIVVTRLRPKDPAPADELFKQPSADLSDWQTSYQHMVASGQMAQLTSPSPLNATRAFPAPVEPSQQ